MKMLLDITLPHEPFNAAVRDGSVGTKLERILEATRPESVYFTEQQGKRGALLVVELPDPSKLPSLVEPWMLLFEADIKLRPVMSPDELGQAGLDSLGKQWG